METATNEEISKMMQKPCPECDGDHMYYEGHLDNADVVAVGDKTCPTHNPSVLKDCCMKNPEAHKM